MNNIFVEKSALIAKHLLLLEGTSRTGKFFLGKIISNFENIEYYQYLNNLENIPIILKAGGMTENAAASLIKLTIDESFYYQGLGRNINLRYDDASSIYHSLEMNKYLRRSLSPYDKQLKEEILKNGEKRSAFYIIPDTFSLIEIFFKTYSDLKLVKEIRHPIDLIYSCYVNGFGWRHENDPIAFHMVLKNSIPWYAIDWEDEYLSLPDIDRVIKSINYLLKLEIDVFNALTKKQKRQILIVRYENLVEKTNETIEQISKFLNKSPLIGMPTVLARERVPRPLSLEDRKEKNMVLKDKASKKHYKILLDMVDDYHENKFNELDNLLW